MSTYESVSKEVRELLSNAEITEDTYVVFDIDYTLLTSANVAHLFESPSDVFKWQYRACFAGIPEIVSLYKQTLAKGIKVLLVTGRKEPLRNATIKNLKAVGIEDWHAIYFKPSGRKVDTGMFKAGIRKSIYDNGGKILFNIGDQDSDLEGGYAEHTFKLPSVY